MKTALGGLLALLVVATSTPARAELEWRSDWARFRASEAIVTGVTGAGLITLYIVPRVPPTWGGPLLFDGALRNTFRTDSPTVRDNWQRWSTWGYYTMVAYPLLIDGLAVPLARGKGDVAAQVSLINLEAFAITGFLFRATESLVRRARPYVWECIERTGNYDQCKDEGLGGTNSFVSGHVTLASAGAALMCTHHAHLSLYGSPWDAIACGVGISVAGAVAIGRMVTDNHYATDILAGAVVGGLTGWLVPTALHYGFKGTNSAPVPTASSSSIGIAWAGVL